MNFIFLRFIEVRRQWVLSKVKVTPFGRHLLLQSAYDPLRSYFDEPQKYLIQIS